MRLAEAKARRTVVLRNSSFKPTDVKNPNGCNERALTPLPGPRAETKVDMGDVVFLPNDCLLCRGTDTAMAATSVSMVTIHYPVCAAGNSEHTVQVVRSI